MRVNKTIMLIPDYEKVQSTHVQNQFFVLLLSTLQMQIEPAHVKSVPNG